MTGIRDLCSPDNSACEGFFGRIKNEVFYGRDWKGWTLDDFMYFIDRYLISSMVLHSMESILLIAEAMLGTTDFNQI